MKPEDIPAGRRASMALVLDELQLYGYRPFAGDPDPRPLPDGDTLQGGLADIFDTLAAMFTDSRLEPDLEELMWSATNLFHRMATRVDRDLDANEQAQKRCQRDQDGSEIRSVELETLTAEGVSLIERRDAFEAMRDVAAEHFEAHLGQAWRPHSGSRVNHRKLTASMIDSRDFLNAKRRSEIEPLLPPGPKVAFSGGLDCMDHRAVWDALDRVRTKHPDMVLVHGGSPKGAEKIAACWADNRDCRQIVFKPDWKRFGKAAPFKRNDAVLEILPIGLVIFPGSGITDNLADKAKQLGIPLFDFRTRASAAAS